MPQQINLCLPILLTPKRYFSAQTLVQAWVIFMLVGGGLSAYGVWSLKMASAGLAKTLATQARELDSLKAAIAQAKEGAAPAQATLAKDLQGRKAQLQQRESLLADLQQGLFRPGWGHSDRLQLVAQSIPAQVWVTQVNADQNQLDVTGLTLEPAVLNDWVAKLAASPLLQGQKLSTIKVEEVNAATAKAAATRPLWSFNLLSAMSKPLDKPVAAAGGKP
jgi:Tfp pilus assembly protein PilN